MGRIFDGKGNQRGADAVMSEQEDIDSDFMPQSEHSMISVDDGSVNEVYYGSRSGRKKDKQKDGIPNRSDSYDSSSDSYSDSDSDSVEYYSEGNDDDDDESYYEDDDEYENPPPDPPQEKDNDSHSDTSPTSVSQMNSTADTQTPKKEKKGSKKGGFLGRLFSGKIVSKIAKKKDGKRRSSELSDGDIDASSYSASSNKPSSKSYPQTTPFDESFDVDIVDDASRSISQPHSQATYFVGDVKDDETQDVTDSSSAQSKKNSQDRIKKNYELVLPGVIEVAEEREDGADKEEGYKAYSVALPKDPDEEHSFGSFSAKKGGDKENNLRNNTKSAPRLVPLAPEATPLPPEQKTKKSKVKGSQSPHSTKAKKKAQKAEPKVYVSALAARNHAGSSRINYAGQISNNAGQITSLTANTTEKLNSEVHRLRTLVELMMTRMELYERQSECLVETSLEHNRQWKVATIQNSEATSKKRVKQSPTEIQLSHIKNLLIERSIQDKWIRQLETIQRGYQHRLKATDDQLKSLRSEHVQTSQQIVDMKKGGGGSRTDSSYTNRTTETPIEDSNNGIVNGELTPVAHNIPMQRWASDPRGPASDHDLLNSKSSHTSNTEGSKTTVQSIEPEGNKLPTSLLDEMIVSWHIDATDMSPLSEKGASYKKKKNKKDKKKKKKDKKHKNGSVTSSLVKN